MLDVVVYNGVRLHSIYLLFKKNNCRLSFKFFEIKKAKIDLRGNHFGQGFAQIIERPVVAVIKY